MKSFDAEITRADRLSRSAPFTDVHCHCLPGLDDGPSDLPAALALCRALAADRIATVVATPHQLGRYDGLYDGATIRQNVAQLNEVLTEARIPLTLLPGADVRIDERMVELVQSDGIVTVADGRRYLLLELPHEVFIDPEMLLGRLLEAGLCGVITHPERHMFLAERAEYVRRWAPYRPCLQITAGSFLGRFGRRSERAAWDFLYAPFPALVATDAHDTTDRAPCMTQAYQRLSRYIGREGADILCVENPRRMVAGEDLITLNPVGDDLVPG
jgi:protein-tyrosine phosphatase